jgi:hypothetical protein
VAESIIAPSAGQYGLGAAHRRDTRSRRRGIARLVPGASSYSQGPAPRACGQSPPIRGGGPARLKAPLAGPAVLRRK